MMYNKTLQRQIEKHFGEPGQIPENLLPVFKVINDSYDRYEKDRIVTGHAVGLRSNEMIEPDTTWCNEKNEPEKTHKERHSQPRLIKGNGPGRVGSFQDSTEQANTEEALRKSEKRLRQIIDLVPHFIFAKDVKGKFILANEAVARAYGSTVENLIGKSDADFNPNKDEVEHFVQEDLEVINSGNARYNIEETITDAAGHTRILSTTKIPYTSDDADMPGVLGVSVDISERKKAETVLKENEGQLSIAARIAKLGYWELDVLNGLFTFTDQFYAIFKTTAEKVGGYTMSPDRYAELFVYPDDREIVGKEVAEAINSDDSYFNHEIEHRIIYADGETGHISVHFYIVKDKEGRTIKTFGVNQDITDRKKGEQLIIQSEAKYRSFFETSMDGILLAETNGKIVAANPAACAIFLMTEEEICKAGRTGIIDLTDPRVEPFLQKRQLTGKAKGEIILIRKDGNRFSSDISSSIYTDTYGHERTSIIIRDITERKQAEEKLAVTSHDLQHALNDLNKIMDSSLDVICAVDASGTFLKVSAASEVVWGYKPGELIGKPLFNFVYPEDNEKTQSSAHHVMAGNHLTHFENRYIRKDGSLVTIEWSARWDAKDQVRYGVARDVTEKVLSRKIIEESELRYRSLVEQATDAICIADASLKFVDMNPYACQILGYSKEEALQLSLPDILFAEDLKTNPLKFDEVRSKKIIRNERRFKRKDGASVIMEVSTKLIEDGRFMMFGHDISERKKTESILKESGNQLTIATQIAKLGYWEFDVTNNLFKFNDQFYSIFKTTAEQVGGYTMSSQQYASLFVYPDDIPLVAKEAADSIKSTDSYYNRQIEHRIKYGNGGIGYVAARFFIVKNELGRTIKTFGAIQDITERKKAEETLRRSEAELESKNQELEQKNKELEQFVYVASHDMQEPLRTTSSFVELLQKQYKGRLDKNADKYLTFISQSSERMKDLIKDLLDYSRIGRKKELAAVDCNITLNEVLADLGTAINEAHAEIKSDHLPVIGGYPTEIKQLFQNLIINALKFRKQNKAPDIHIGVQKKDSYWEFAFKDNGIGIEEQHQERIFIIFQRLHTRSEYEGSGIGLAHCKKIVELHGGKIWVKSIPGEGSAFHFIIPEINNS